MIHFSQNKICLSKNLFYLLALTVTILAGLYIVNITNNQKVAYKSEASTPIISPTLIQTKCVPYGAKWEKGTDGQCYSIGSKPIGTYCGNEPARTERDKYRCLPTKPYCYELSCKDGTPTNKCNTQGLKCYCMNDISQYESPELYQDNNCIRKNPDLTTTPTSPQLTCNNSGGMWYRDASCAVTAERLWGTGNGGLLIAATVPAGGFSDAASYPEQSCCKRIATCQSLGGNWFSAAAYPSCSNIGTNYTVAKGNVDIKTGYNCCVRIPTPTPKPYLPVRE